MLFSKQILCLLCIGCAPLNAWSIWESQAEKNARIETLRRNSELQMKKQHDAIVLKSNYRLQSSYNALKEARKAMVKFVIVWPMLAAVIYQFDAELGKSYASWTPYSLFALFVMWGAENILHGQIELNKELHERQVNR